MKRPARGLLLAAVLLAGCRDEPAPAAHAVPEVPELTAAAERGRPVLFVGLDGADWQLLDGYAARGLMPNLAALVREGRAGVLRTQQPPLSPLLWTTMTTGVGPLAHRILDFTRRDPATGAEEPITAAERRTPAVWNMASWAGRRVAVFGLWATWPAEPVNGLLVADRLASFTSRGGAPAAGVVFPPERRRGRAKRSPPPSARWITPRSAPTSLGSTVPPTTRRRRTPTPTPTRPPRSATSWSRPAPGTGWPPTGSPTSVRTSRSSTSRAPTRSATSSPPSRCRASLRSRPRTSRATRGCRSATSRRWTACSGEYRQLAERNGAVLMLASDHGFLWGEGRPQRLASAAAATAGRWHREEGMYLLWGPGIQAGERASGLDRPGVRHAPRAFSACRRGRG